MRTSIVLASAALVASVSAINPQPQGIQQTWCNGQVQACPQLCGGTFLANKCTPGASVPDYNCTCTNGTAPGLAYYANTVPTFECQEQFSECIAGNQSDAQAQTQCGISNSCGKLNAASAHVVSTPSTSSTSSSAAASTSASTTATGGASQTSPAAAASSTPAHSMALSVGQQMGMGIFAVSLMAVFGLML